MWPLPGLFTPINSSHKLTCYPKEDSSIREMWLHNKMKKVIKKCKKSQPDSKRSPKVNLNLR